MASRAWRREPIRWDVAEPSAEAEDLARKAGTPPLVAQILCNRGINDPEAARAFLNPKLSDLHCPTLLPGAEAAARRIARAVAGKQRIVIYGDYDVDGITAVAILRSCLAMLDADVHYYVPHRLEEGYGVNAEAVRRIIADGTGLLITVDCGISAVEPLAEATAAGVDVIITDHHAPGNELPAASAIVHPAIGPDAYPNKDLSGAGVAFKLAWQVAREICGERRVDDRMRNFLLDATCLAALGTIADVVPLVGENRALATYGLRGLPATEHPGLRALIHSARLDGQKLEAYHVGFALAPRLNACGRMGHARLAVELLTEAPPDRAEKIARHLAKRNAQRQEIERDITAQAVEMVQADGLDDPACPAIVLAGENWHAGVIGIVAARLVDRFHRPSFIIALDAEQGRGSGRSIPGFDLYGALKACDRHLVSYGGHEMACGLRIDRSRTGEFSAAFSDWARRNLTDKQLTPALAIDAQTNLSALTYDVAHHISRMAPFGQGNPRPVVAVRDCRVMMPPRRMGRSGQTISLLLGQNDSRIRAVGFGMGDLADLLAGVSQVDVAGEPVLNTFGGRTSLELKLRDVKWE